MHPVPHFMFGASLLHRLLHLSFVSPSSRPYVNHIHPILQQNHPDSADDAHNRHQPCSHPHSPTRSTLTLFADVVLPTNRRRAARATFIPTGATSSTHTRRTTEPFVGTTPSRRCSHNATSGRSSSSAGVSRHTTATRPITRICRCSRKGNDSEPANNHDRR